MGSLEQKNDSNRRCGETQAVWSLATVRPYLTTNKMLTMRATGGGRQANYQDHLSNFSVNLELYPLKKLFKK